MGPPQTSKSMLKYRFLSLALLKSYSQGARAPSDPRAARHCLEQPRLASVLTGSKFLTADGKAEQFFYRIPFPKRTKFRPSQRTNWNAFIGRTGHRGRSFEDPCRISSDKTWEKKLIAQYHRRPNCIGWGLSIEVGRTINKNDNL